MAPVIQYMGECIVREPIRCMATIGCTKTPVTKSANARPNRSTEDEVCNEGVLLMAQSTIKFHVAAEKLDKMFIIQIAITRESLLGGKYPGNVIGQ